MDPAKNAGVKAGNLDSRHGVLLPAGFSSF